MDKSIKRPQLIRLLIILFEINGSLYLLLSIFDIGGLMVEYGKVIETLIVSIPTFVFFLFWFYFLARALADSDHLVLRGLDVP
jgi:hypothetical protein